jgi:hypothetical protein
LLKNNLPHPILYLSGAVLYLTGGVFFRENFGKWLAECVLGEIQGRNSHFYGPRLP